MIEKTWPKTVKIVSISLHSMVASIKGMLIGAISSFNYKLARAEALRRCEQETRKCYVVQADAVNWKVFTSADVKDYKRRRIFKKTVTAKEMMEKSAFIAMPKNNGRKKN